MKRTIQRLKQINRVLLVSHINPDGDALGSLIALGLSLEAMGKQVTCYNESRIPAVYRFLPSVDRIVCRPGPLTMYDAAVFLDCGQPERIGTLAAACNGMPLVINIDHHVTNTGFGHCRYIDTSACATAELIYRLIKAMNVPICLDIATSIYTGILTDTGSFRFANTNRAAFAICDEMVRKGVDPYEIATHVYGTYSLGRIKLLNLALESIEISENGKLSFMMLTREMFDETATQPEDIDGMINYAKQIEDVKVAVLIQEHINGAERKKGRKEKQAFNVSLRSDGSVDVSALASNFGGGGHPRAAGFSIKSTLAELKGGIIEWLEDRKPGICGHN